MWNLSNTDTLGTKIIVLISEVSLFEGENKMYLYKVGTQSSVLINQVSLFPRCPLREVPLYQSHSHQVWSGQVCSAYVSKLQLGGLGACSPRKFRGYAIASETSFGPIRYFSEARCFGFWSFANLASHMHPLQMEPVRL